MIRRRPRAAANKQSGRERDEVAKCKCRVGASRRKRDPGFRLVGSESLNLHANALKHVTRVLRLRDQGERILLKPFQYVSYHHYRK